MRQLSLVPYEFVHASSSRTTITLLLLNADLSRFWARLPSSMRRISNPLKWLDADPRFRLLAAGALLLVALAWLSHGRHPDPR